MVQICHGAPGLICLLACAKKNSRFMAEFGSSTWYEATELATSVIWEQALVSKGGGLCHGIAGNALPLLMLTDPLGADDLGLMSKSIALLLAAQETRPLSDPETPIATSNLYRMSDNPYSLFEDLSGTLCAWAEACIAIRIKLRHKSLVAEGLSDHQIIVDKEILRLQERQVGFPCIGGGALCSTYGLGLPISIFQSSI